MLLLPTCNTECAGTWVNMIRCTCGAPVLLSLVSYSATAHVRYCPCVLLPMCATAHARYCPCVLLPMCATTHVRYCPCALLPVRATAHVRDCPCALLPMNGTARVMWYTYRGAEWTSHLLMLPLLVLLPSVIMAVAVSGCTMTASMSPVWLTAEVLRACSHTRKTGECD